MVKFAIWNIRGLNLASKRKEVKRIICENGLCMCAIVETKVCKGNLRKFCKDIFGNWDWVSNNSVCVGRTRIIVGWDSNKVKMEFFDFSNQVIHGRFFHIDSKKKFFCSLVYAANDVVQRRCLWDQLRKFKHLVNGDAWVVLGDFNVGLDPGDSSRGSSTITRGMSDFRDCVCDIEVEDIRQSGLMFTWVQKPMSDGGSNGLLKKLDRVLGNLKFVGDFPSAYANFLPYGLSDHSPAVVTLQGLCVFKPKPFKFSNHLADKSGFVPLVLRAWCSNVVGCSMFSVVSKLKKVKKDLRKLNVEVGNVFDKVKNFRKELENSQIDIDIEPENGDLRLDGAVYLKALKEALVDEEKVLRQRSKVQWLREGDANTSYFHSVVKSRTNKARIDEVADIEGNRFFGEAVPDQFVKHFKSILGSSDIVQPIFDPDSLFLKKLSKGQSEAMIRPVEDKEIKDALFDIDDIKAPGPDGFSSCFFKKSWHVIGAEVCDAIKEFFYNGKLLGEVNATVIALVPKSQSPSSVADYRPIACCNVLYKCISKILVNRIKDSLSFLVDPNQSAFIPNRQICDNVLLAQELMRGYHRQRGVRRCAFKVDIQKAYDTVNWEFLECILKNFGFHPCMVAWIMKCVSSASFTIRVNGDHFGFFPGKRGIRQGDPLSPYLFTLVMEILTLIVKREVRSCEEFKFHPRCEKIGLTHLCFADDLLMFCYGNVESVMVLKNALLKFGEFSGLKPSMGKSTAFLGNVVGLNRVEILKVLPFKLGSLPVRYLGVPLISTRLYHKDCLGLIEKVKKRVLDWKNKWLSFAGRLQLINSVLSSISVYWASLFLLPVSVVKEIERLLRSFLWSSGEAIKGKAKVKWGNVCLPREKGGLGVRSLRVWNRTLLAKQVWKIIDNNDSLWVKWIHEYRLKGKNFWEVGNVFDASWFWRKAVMIRNQFRDQIVHLIGDGKGTSLWFDNWHSVGPLSNFVTRREIYMAGLSLDLKVNDIVVDGLWMWPAILWSKHGSLLQQYAPVLKPNVRDKVQWKCKNGKYVDFSVSAVWSDVFVAKEDVNWYNLVWFSQGIPRHAFFLWLAIKERLRTMDRLVNWRIKDVNACVLCSEGLESHSHLFVDCVYSKEVWNCLEGVSGVYNLIQRMEGVPNKWHELIVELSRVKAGNSIWSVIHRLVFAAVVYFIWQERNNRLHSDACRPAVKLARQIFELIQMKLVGLKVKNGAHVRRAAEIWNLGVENDGFCFKDTATDVFVGTRSEVGFGSLDMDIVGPLSLNFGILLIQLKQKRCGGYWAAISSVWCWNDHDLEVDWKLDSCQFVFDLEGEFKNGDWNDCNSYSDVLESIE
ncbi:hypothetical protein OSB04_un001606 [Centaurea solstitialis]|uniref:Reverse transcriptase domain-containing protein n=1 Tax=Centaurea solstitialis TaxID=347529 RepID=A0AA38W2G7_9ASTR|nr:hypothetical protein OSB04_un001606 [Centaurea solstitialis]